MAVINVTPLDDISALIASDDVNDGDVLLLEEGNYFQTIIIPKSNIRIVAKGPKVIFDGKNILFIGFALVRVTGVAIEGIHIRNFRNYGIIMESGTGNRIINNTINGILNSGMELVGSSANLLWKNKVSYCQKGIRLVSGSPNNWIIENVVKECVTEALETVSSSDNNNAFIANEAIGNRRLGLGLVGSNNLALNNLVEGDEGIGLQSGNSSLVIGNEIRRTKLATLSIIGIYRNFFAGENHIVCNKRDGMNMVTEYGMFLNNEISYNGDTGISFFVPDAVGNLVKDNKLVCNIPENIHDRGTDNNFINNVDIPCKPCQSPSDVCGECLGQDFIN